MDTASETVPALLVPLPKSAVAVVLTLSNASTLAAAVAAAEATKERGADDAAAADARANRRVQLMRIAPSSRTAFGVCSCLTSACRFWSSRDVCQWHCLSLELELARDAGLLMSSALAKPAIVYLLSPVSYLASALVMPMALESRECTPAVPLPRRWHPPFPCEKSLSSPFQWRRRSYRQGGLLSSSVRC